MFNLSSAEGARFAEVCEEMTRAVKALGPSPLRGKRSEVSGQPPAEPEALEADR